MKHLALSPLSLALAFLSLGCGEPAPPAEPDAARIPRDASIDAAGETLDAASDAASDAPSIPTDDAPAADAPPPVDAHAGPDARHRDGGPRSDVGPCVPVDGGERCPCETSRDCEPGHSCEARVCVDRRVGCLPVEGSDCPWGFVCDEVEGVHLCRRTLVACFGDDECDPGWRCLDTNGDGIAECLADGVCREHAACEGGLTCATRPAERFASCERFGVCADASDCPSGMECRDLWGGGIRECVEPGGCASSAECAAREICATPPEGGPPTCLARPLAAP